MVTGLIIMVLGLSFQGNLSREEVVWSIANVSR